MLTANKIKIVKASLQARIACLNLSKSSMESSLPLKTIRIEDLQNCVEHIKEAEDFLAEVCLWKAVK